MFRPQCLPLLIGSLPLTDHHAAMRLIAAYTPEIPLWPQLPKNPKEGMIRQFLCGFPGLVEAGNRYWIDTGDTGFAAEMALFYEEYLKAESTFRLPRRSRFSLHHETAQGFYALEKALQSAELQPLMVKGQITGPVTTGIGVKDQSGAAIFYNDDLRDILIKLLSLKARWQVEQLQQYGDRAAPIIFIDEPGMVSFSSTAFAGVSREMVSVSVAEVIAAIRQAGGLAGIHICANGDWGPALESDADIISFDAYSYFDNVILYREQLCRFLTRGGVLAWGIVPTGDPAAVAEESVERLYERWLGQREEIVSLGFSSSQVVQQALITPACGTGSLSLQLAEKVLSTTARLAKKIRRNHQEELLV